MNRLTITTWAVSLGLHALVLLAFVDLAASGTRDVYDEGSGRDSFRLEQGLSVEAISLGDAAERLEVAEVTPTTATPKPPEETRSVEPDLTSVVTARESPVEVAAAEVPPPPAEAIKPAEVVAAREQAAQTAVLLHESAGAAQDGGKATALNAYVGKIHGALQRVKAPAVGGAVGQVVLAFTLDGNGKVLDRSILKSSGVSTLDAAALAWIDRAAFPPLPGVLGSGQRFNVPLTFSRKNG